MAGRLADGLVLADPATRAHVRDALERAGRAGSGPEEFHIATFSVLCVESERADAFAAMAPWLARMLADPNPGITAMDCYDDLAMRFAERGVGGLVDMPAIWWREIGPIGTMDDALAHIGDLVEHGVHSVALFPAPDLAIARSQVNDVVALAAAIR